MGCALHAPEVECIGKGKARKPYEFGVKSAVVVSHKHGLMLGARTFPGNPYDGHILSAVLEQATNLKSDHRTDRCWLQGTLGDALHSISCAAGYNLHWLLRAIARLGIGAVFLRLLKAALSQRRALGTSYDASGRVWAATVRNWIGNVVVKKPIFGYAAWGA